MKRKIGAWGTSWRVGQELRDSPGLAFVRRWLSHYDFDSLEWVTLRRGTPRVWPREPIYGRCLYPAGTPSGMFRINCTVDARARYPAQVHDPPVRARFCVVCGAALSASRASHSFCSDRCRSTYHSRMRSARIAARRGKRACEACGRGFTPSRSDAKTCSPACRQRRYRERQAT